MRKVPVAILGYIPLLWFLAFLIGPLALVLVTSFLTRGTYGGVDWIFSVGSYQRAFSGVYFEILLGSLQLAFINTTVCFVIGYPMAWAMATAPAAQRVLFVLLISIPFLMNLIIRVYALRLFAGFEGPLVWMLKTLEIPHDPFAFSQNRVLVMYGMVTAYLPYMVFPIYAALEKFDFSTVEANYDLGGGHFSALFQVLIPNTRAAIAGGCLLVFVPTLGEFVIPDLLGGAKNMLAGNLITEQFLKARDWPFGSALSILLIVILSFATWMISSWGSRQRGKA